MGNSTRAHLHNWALGAFVVKSEETKAEIGRRAQLTPAGIGDLISGRRAGLNPEVRLRIAEALDVDVRAITCRCSDRMGNHIEGAPRKADKSPQKPAQRKTGTDRQARAVQRRVRRFAEVLRRRVAEQYRQDSPKETPYDVMDWALDEVEGITQRLA